MRIKSPTCLLAGLIWSQGGQNMTICLQEGGPDRLEETSQACVAAARRRSSPVMLWGVFTRVSESLSVSK